MLRNSALILIVLLMSGCISSTPELQLTPIPTPAVLIPSDTPHPTAFTSICGESQLETPEAATGNSPEILSVAVSRHGIWTTTESGIRLYDGVHLRRCADINARLFAFVGDTIWVVSGFESLYRYQGSWEKIAADLIPGEKINDIQVVDETVYLATDTGIVVLKDGVWVQYLTPPGKDHEIISFSIRDPDILIGTRTDGFWWYDGTTFRHACEAGCEERISANLVREVHVGKFGKIYLLTHNGIDIFDGKNWTDYRQPSHFTNRLAIDYRGYLWAGTNDGVFVFVNGSWLPVLDYTANDLAFGCRECPFDQSVIVVGTRGSGLFYGFLEKKGEFET